MSFKIKIQTLLRNEWFLAICLLSIFLAANGYRYGWDDQHLEIPLLKSLIDNTLYQGDYYVESLKKKYTSFFYPLLARLITIEQIPSVYFILYLISRYFLFFWIYKIWQLITKEKATAFLCTFVFIVMGRVEEFLYRTFSHQEFTLAIIFAGLYFFYKERFILASAILGITLNLHALYGIMAMMYVGFYLLVFLKKYGWRLLLKSYFSFVIMGAPFILWTIQRMMHTHIPMDSPLLENWQSFYLRVCPTDFIFGSVPLVDIFANLKVFLTATQDYLLVIILFILNITHNKRFQNDSKGKLIALTVFISLFLSFIFTYIKPVRLVLDLNLLRHIQFLKFFLMGYTTILVIDVIKKSTPFFNFLIAIGFSGFNFMLYHNSSIASISTISGVSIFFLLSFQRYHKRWKSHKHTIVMIFYIIGLILCLIGTISLYVQSELRAQLFIRVYVILALLSINYFLIRRETRILSPIFLKSLFIIIPVIVKFTAFTHYNIAPSKIAQREKSPSGELLEDWEDMQRYVQINTPKDALFLVPYDMAMGGFRIFSERKIICSYRDCSLVGFDHPAALEWQKRIKDISPFKVFTNQPMVSAVVNAIMKYHADYIVFMRYYDPVGDFPELKKIYENDIFSLFKVDVQSFTRKINLKRKKRKP